MSFSYKQGGSEFTTTVLVTADFPIETHSNFAVAMHAYTHADAGFRAPYLNFYKSRGTQLDPTPVTLTGYELDSIGGINFGGWNGEEYAVGCGIYSQTDENWSPTAMGCHISIYCTSRGETVTPQIIQFSGLDPTDQAAGTGTIDTNIISFRPISFGGNKDANPCLVPHNTVSPTVPPWFSLEKADTSGLAGLKCLHQTHTGASDPTTSDIPAGYGARWKNTGNGEVRDWVNDGGTMKKSAAFTT